MRALNFEETDRIPIVGGFERHPEFLAEVAVSSGSVASPINDMARVHLTTPTMDRFGTVAMKSVFNASVSI